jgi:hypothetical protein
MVTAALLWQAGKKEEFLRERSQVMELREINKAMISHFTNWLISVMFSDVGDEKLSDETEKLNDPLNTSDFQSGRGRKTSAPISPIWKVSWSTQILYSLLRMVRKRSLSRSSHQHTLQIESIC